MICALLALRPISHITKKTLSYLDSTKIEQMTKTMVDDGNFSKRCHFSLLHSLRSNTTTNFRPAACPYHTILSTLPLAVLVSPPNIYPPWKGAPAIRAGVFVFHPPIYPLIRWCQLSVRDQSQIGRLSAWSELNYFVYRKLSSRAAFFQVI